MLQLDFKNILAATGFSGQCVLHVHSYLLRRPHPCEGRAHVHRGERDVGRSARARDVQPAALPHCRPTGEPAFTLRFSSVAACL